MQLEPITEKSRQLDAWVAEHIMGFRRVKSPSELTTGTFSVHPVELHVFVYSHQNVIERFSPTTRDGDAFAVLEQIVRKMGSFQELLMLFRTDANYANQYQVYNRSASDVGLCANFRVAICGFAKAHFKPLPEETMRKLNKISKRRKKL